MRHFYWLVAAVFATAGCGDTASDTEPIEAFRTNSGLSFAECPEVQVQYNFLCTDAYAAAEDCLNDGFATCSPTHLRQTVQTVEGDPVYYHLFVVPSGDSCSVVVFSDNRADEFAGETRVRRTDCEGVERTPVEAEPDACSLMLGETCSEWR